MNSTRELILAFIVVILITIMGIKQLFLVAVDCKNNFVAKNEKTAVVEDLRVKADAIKKANERMAQQQDVLKPFYKQDVPQNDSIAAFGGMFEDMVDYIKINGLLLRSIEYNIKPEADLIYKNFATTYNVCEIKLFIIGTYPQLKGFLKDVEMYPYFISVSQLNIVPYESNKKFLLVNMSINLYSKR